MVTLQFLAQTGKVSQRIQVNVTSMSDKAVLSAAYNESVINGRDIELLNVVQDSDANDFVNAMIFGISPDSKLKEVAGNSVFPTFFQSGRLYSFLILKNNTDAAVTVFAGTTPGGTDLINGVDLAANSYQSVLIQYTASEIAPLYVWSSDWNEANINISTISDAI